MVRSPPSNSVVVHTAPATREATGKELAPDVPTLRAVLEDAQFSSVKERLRAKDAAGAAKAFDDARAATVEAPGGRTCALDYESGRLHRDAGEDAAALAAFDRVPEACALSAHAALYAAQACSRLGRTDDAIARARRVPDDTAIASEARLTLAEALAAKGDRGAALPIWRAHLAANPHGTRWVDTAVKVATALLDGVHGERAGHAREAFDLATRVVVEAPKLAEASGGQAARDRAVALLRQSDPKLDDSLAVSDRVRRAQAWLDANEPAHAVAEVTPLLALGAPSVPVGADVCHAAIVRAQATAKLRGATADAYGDAIARCAGDDALPSALFAGAKASLSAKHLDEGLARLARVEQEFPATGSPTTLASAGRLSFSRTGTTRRARRSSPPSRRTTPRVTCAGRRSSAWRSRGWSARTGFGRSNRSIAPRRSKKGTIAARAPGGRPTSGRACRR